MSKKKGFALRSFKDAGTEERFEKGRPVELEAGVYDNYAAAGLVADKMPESPAKATEAGAGGKAA